MVQSRLYFKQRPELLPSYGRTLNVRRRGDLFPHPAESGPTSVVRERRPARDRPAPILHQTNRAKIESRKTDLYLTGSIRESCRRRASQTEPAPIWRRFACGQFGPTMDQMGIRSKDVLTLDKRVIEWFVFRNLEQPNQIQPLLNS